MNFAEELKELSKEIKSLAEGIQETPQYEKMVKTEKNYAEDEEAILVMEKFQKAHSKASYDPKAGEEVEKLQKEIQNNSVITEHIKAQEELMEVCGTVAGAISKHIQVDFTAAAASGNKCNSGCC